MQEPERSVSIADKPKKRRNSVGHLFLDKKRIKIKVRLRFQWPPELADRRYAVMEGLWTAT
jgi:hypothetical protein